MKLLNRTLLGFLIYSVALLLAVTPVLYLVINKIIISKVDDTLQIHKREISERLKGEDVLRWEDLDGEVVVKPLQGPPVADRIFTENNYRVLSGSVSIDGKLYAIEARISLVESEDLISALVLTQVIVLVTLIAGMLIINWWNSRTVWTPFYNTLNRLKSFSIEKDTPLTLQPSSVSEFNDLNAAIEELIKRDLAAFVNQREFTENAAHEMQTPLAVFQSKLDLLLQTKPSADQAVIIESLLDTTQRLNRLNKALLLLAKIDNKQFREVEEVGLCEATRDVTKIPIEGEDLLVSINSVLLDILLTNLVSNAVRYSSDPSKISIKISNNSWSISNPGPPLSIPPEKIFLRFQKGNTNKESLGLGLAIAKKICDTNDLVLSYSFIKDTHSFTVRFPNSKISPKSIR